MPLLIGRDARRIEDTWQYLYKGAYWRRGPVTMTAIAAVDTALWDIKGKALDTPVYQLLGGASREAVMVYGHANGDDIDETVDSGRGATSSMGYKAVRAQCGDPRVPSTPTASARGKLYYEPAEKGMPLETRLEHRALPRLRAAAVRSGCARSSAPTFTCCTTSTIG